MLIYQSVNVRAITLRLWTRCVAIKPFKKRFLCLVALAVTLVRYDRIIKTTPLEPSRESITDKSRDGET